MIQIWVYDIKRTELLKPLSCTDANSTNPEAKCGLLFIKCRWVSFFNKSINRCLNLGTRGVTISGIFWTFLSSFLHWNLLCSERSQPPSPDVEPGLFCCLCRVLFICSSPVFPLIFFIMIRKWGKSSLEIQLCYWASSGSNLNFWCCSVSWVQTGLSSVNFCCLPLLPGRSTRCNQVT